MKGQIIASMRHFLDENGCIPQEMPGQALKLALFLGSIVEWMTRISSKDLEATNVVCRKSPGRRPCTGNIHAMFAPDESIYWYCPFCEDSGVIHDWQETGWDRSNEV